MPDPIHELLASNVFPSSGAWDIYLTILIYSLLLLQTFTNSSDHYYCFGIPWRQTGSNALCSFDIIGWCQGQHSSGHHKGREGNDSERKKIRFQSLNLYHPLRRTLVKRKLEWPDPPNALSLKTPCLSFLFLCLHSQLLFTFYFQIRFY